MQKRLGWAGHPLRVRAAGMMVLSCPRNPKMVKAAAWAKKP